MNIAGVLVHSRPESVEEVTQSLAACPGVEVHAAVDGRIVVTVEGENANDLADLFQGFSGMSGVLSTALVYHHFESDIGQEN